MDKLKLAHDWAMKSFLTDGFKDEAERVDHAWKYADAMQAEADKREDKARPEVLLTKDKDGKCLHFHHDFGHKKCMDCGASLEKWQPDWITAPDDAKYWAMDKDHTANFFKNKPEATNGNGWDFGGVMQSNNSHSYQGNWQDSLRKRPEALCEVDCHVAPEWANWWAIRQNSSGALWCVNKPTVTEDCFLSHGGCGVAPSFGFAGSHVVERPHGF